MTQTDTVHIDRSPPASHAARPGYRPDVEGLRAVAVLLVLAAHAGVTAVAGGFVGVDVFFVISGFLITQMLVRELRATGRLRLRRFYARRARRLLPASATVLVVSTALAAAFLPVNRWADTAYDVIFSALYAVNWRFAAQSVDYLHADSAPSIVQHFWSLAVEEQFYLVWPCLLLGAVLAARHYGRSVNTAIVLALVVIGVPSLAWSVYYTQENPARAYFVSTTRLWELALGAAVAILAVHGRALPRAVAVVAGWLGLAAILGAGVWFTTATPFPSWWALGPTVGTALVIMAGLSGTGPAGSANRLLATRPMQFVGGLSYSIYLCHWPLVVVATALLGELHPAVGVAVVLLSIAPAYLLHVYVENPVRFSRTHFVRSSEALRGAAVVTVLTVTVGMGLQLANWPPPPPFAPPAISKLAAGPAEEADAAAATGGAAGGVSDAAKANPNAVLGAAILGEDPLGDQNGAPRDSYPTIVPGPEVAADDYTNCTQSADSAEIRTCTYGKRGSDVVVAVVGDSHANQWVAGLAEVADARGWELREYTKAACTFSDVLIATKEGQPYTSCQDWSAAVLDRLLTAEKPTMVIASALAKGVFVDGEVRYDAAGQSTLAAGVHRYYEALNNAGIPVTVMVDTPRVEINIPECVLSNPDKLTACARDRGTAVPADQSIEQIEAAQGLPQVRLVDMNDAICPTDMCAPVIGNVLVYRDTSHLTGTYVRTLVPRLEAKIAEVKPS